MFETSYVSLKYLHGFVYTQYTPQVCSYLQNNPTVMHSRESGTSHGCLQNRFQGQRNITSWVRNIGMDGLQST